MSSFTANTNRRELLLSGKKIILITNDGERFEVPEEIAKVSEHIKETIEMSIEELEPTMDLVNINGTTLAIIINYMEEYLKEPFDPIPKPLPKEGLGSILREYYNDLLNINFVRANISDYPVDASAITSNSSRCIEGTSLTELLTAANFLQIPSLKQLIAAKIADSVRNKNIQQIFKLYGVPNHVPSWEDLERVRNEHAYAFE